MWSHLTRWLTLQELVQQDQLLEDTELTKYLLHNMWNYSDISEQFTVVFQQCGVFLCLQHVLKDPRYRDKMANDEVPIA